jgi:hypothetical protein
MPRFLTEVLTWRNHEWMVPVIRTAISFGKPPLQLLLEDPSHVDLTRWDLKLINAFSMLETYSVDGQPIWYEEDETVEFVPVKKKYRAAYALEKAQDRDQKARTDAKGNVRPAFGERWHVEPKFLGERPTFEGWLRGQGGSKADHVDLIDADPATLTKAERQQQTALKRKAAIRAARGANVD